MRSGDKHANLRVDAVERIDDTLFAYRRRGNEVTPSEFVGMFSLGSVDYIYVSEGKEEYNCLL